AILAMGILRFALSLANVPNSIVKYASMTVIIMAGFIYYAIVCDARRERLKAAYLLILPYMVVEVAALGYTWATGDQTIFHATEYSFGTGIAAHTVGHLVGGLTWEPLFIFLIMEIIHALYVRVRPLRRPARTA